MLMPSDIVDAVEAILREAAKGKGDRPNFLTSYQILDRLPQPTRDRLIQERGIGGEGAGAPFTAPSLISQAAAMLGDRVVIDYIDNRGLLFEVAGQQCRGGVWVCAIYRLRA